MTRARRLQVMWLVLGAALWFGIWDYIVARGMNEYLYRNAELRLGIAPPPGKSADMREVLSGAKINGAIQATVWTVVITGAGLLTVRVLSPRNS